MARKWSKAEIENHKKILKKLYITENKTIREISLILKIAQSTVYDRLIRLRIPTCRSKKKKFNNIRESSSYIIPETSALLAEFFGIMLGDGNLTHHQVTVTLGSKEYEYAQYVQSLISKIFLITPTILTFKKTKYSNVYFGCVEITKWLQKEGLVFNKVKSQVSVPEWILEKKEFCTAFLRGFFDTDGSIYKLRFGVQIAFINYSRPILIALQKMLQVLQYHPSNISNNKLYLTKREEIIRFFNEVKPANCKHLLRYNTFIKK